MPKYTDSKGERIIISSSKLGSGGEGDIYKIINSTTYDNHCIKLYRKDKRNQRHSKILYMVQHPPSEIERVEQYKICWPVAMLYDSGEFCGFIMPLAYQDSKSPYELCIPEIHKDMPQDWHNIYNINTDKGKLSRLKLCVNIAIAIDSIHKSNCYVLLDMKPQNLLVTSDGKVSVIDFDSVQITQNKKVIHKGSAATPEYMPPESNAYDFNKKIPIPISWDNFSLAVMFYQILHGIHPYASTVKSHNERVSTIGQKINQGYFVHGRKRNQIEVTPSPHNKFPDLSPELQELFRKAFDTKSPSSRPTASQWGATLHKAISEPLIPQITTKSRARRGVRTQKNPTSKVPPTYKTPKRVPKTPPAVVKTPPKPKSNLIPRIAVSILLLLGISFGAIYTGAFNQSIVNRDDNNQTTIDRANQTVSNFIDLVNNKRLNEAYNFIDPSWMSESRFFNEYKNVVEINCLNYEEKDMKGQLVVINKSCSKTTTTKRGTYNNHSYFLDNQNGEYRIVDIRTQMK